ncbi:hypothetical protein RRF57_012117 [Xylaria bambusicola]|uniref:Uncharacterized protein n=1 Tax=Xylaria bambusicola TaxID=326684 RepID=A0AAN7UP07_9PEZI
MTELFGEMSELSSAVTAYDDAQERRVEKLRDTILHNLIQQLAELRNLLQSVQRRNAVLASLLFDTIKTRFDRIENSYPNTLDWVVKMPLTNFRTWLETGDGIYWISGLVRGSPRSSNALNGY